MVGPQSYHRLPELLREARRWPGVVAADFPAEDKFDHLPEATPGAICRRGFAAFVTVQEGCDKFCSFCVVPYTRGAEASAGVGHDTEQAELVAACTVTNAARLAHRTGRGLGQMVKLVLDRESAATTPGRRRASRRSSGRR